MTQRADDEEARTREQGRADAQGEDPGQPDHRHQHPQEDESCDGEPRDLNHSVQRGFEDAPVAPDDGDGRDEEGGEGAQEETRGDGRAS